MPDVTRGTNTVVGGDDFALIQGTKFIWRSEYVWTYTIRLILDSEGERFKKADVGVTASPPIEEDEEEAASISKIKFFKKALIF